VVFYIAGIYGLPVMLVGYFSESWISGHYPPAVTHPEYFYGFMGLALAWQVAFLFIARDPLRYRSFMIPSMLAKLGYAVAVLLLYLQHRLDAALFWLGSADWIFLLGFIAAYVVTKPRADRTRREPARAPSVRESKHREDA
jgi:hypothetical protein